LNKKGAGDGDTRKTKTDTTTIFSSTRKTTRLNGLTLSRDVFVLLRRTNFVRNEVFIPRNSDRFHKRYSLAKPEQLKQDSRRGQPKQDSQKRKAKIGQPKQGSKKRTVKAGPPV
jgi:hypothetical protein